MDVPKLTSNRRINESSVHISWTTQNANSKVVRRLTNSRSLPLSRWLTNCFFCDANYVDSQVTDKSSTVPDFVYTRRPFSVQGGPLLIFLLRLRRNRSSLGPLSVAINQAQFRLGQSDAWYITRLLTRKTWNPRNVFLQAFLVRYPLQIPLPASKHGRSSRFTRPHAGGSSMQWLYRHRRRHLLLSYNASGVRRHQHPEQDKIGFNRHNYGYSSNCYCHKLHYKDSNARRHAPDASFDKKPM